MMHPPADNFYKESQQNKPNKQPTFKPQQKSIAKLSPINLKERGESGVKPMKKFMKKSVDKKKEKSNDKKKDTEYTLNSEKKLKVSLRIAIFIFIFRIQNKKNLVYLLNKLIY